ncbi:MAG: sortase [bacterium]|nr:sortase [bacterium]
MYRRRQSAGCSIRLLIIVGVLLGIGYVGYDFFRASQIQSGSSLLPSLPELPADGQPVAAAPSPEGTAPAQPAGAGSNVPVSDIDSANTRLFIPSAGIEAPITQVFLDSSGSWDVSYLGQTVGHLQGTAWLDDAPGNIVLSGHVELADGRQGVFATLDEVTQGEIIIITRGDEERRYVVTTVSEVEPDDLTPLYPTDEEILTLITCGEYNFFSDQYEVRQVVVAERLNS